MYEGKLLIVVGVIYFMFSVESRRLISFVIENGSGCGWRS